MSDLRHGSADLFETLVHVDGGLRSDGSYVAPYTRVQKKRAKPAPKRDERTPDLFGDHHEAPQIALFPADTATLPIVGAEPKKSRKPRSIKPAPNKAAEPVEAENPRSTELAAGLDYSKPFAEIAIPQFGVRAGTSKAERRRINAEVVQLVDVDQPDLDATQRALLTQYSGNGGCGDSLNEFYTDPAVAAAMWKAMRTLGFERGEVLEPSCGAGVFMATAPGGVRVTGVELDGISAAVAKELHGEKHDIVNRPLEGFVTQDGDRQFDAVIGNAPFGLRGALISQDKSDLSTAEGYFLDTALDKTKPGGLVAMIVPTGVMDGRNTRALRERLLRKAEFLGATRMPNTAFEHSHTEVTTDIVFFRKRPDDVAGALSVVDQAHLQKLGVWDEDYLSGGYFQTRGAPRILGSMEAGWRAKAGMGQDITVVGSMAGVPAEVAAFEADEVARGAPTVSDVIDAIGDDSDLVAKARGAAMRRPYADVKPGDTKVVDGVTYVAQGSPIRWHRVDEFMQSSDVADAIDIAADMAKIVEDYGDASDTALQRGLAERIREWVEKYGIPAKSDNLVLAAGQDKRLYRLIGAVGLDGRLSDFALNKRSERLQGSVDTVAAAMALASESRDFSASDLARTSGRSLEEVGDLLFASENYAYLGNDRWTNAENYLSGELWPKLDAAREAAAADPGMAAKLLRQADALETAIDPKALEDVEVMLNSGFIPLNVVAAFYTHRRDVMGADNHWVREQPKMDITFAGGVYAVNGGIPGDKALLSSYLNRSGVKKEELPKLAELNAEFKDWLCQSQYRDEVETLYNRKFCGFIPQVFSDAPMDIPGLATEGLKSFQYSGLRWALAAGKGIIAADVGLGKTVRALMLARVAKLTGRASKPMIVVPKSVLANWDAEAAKWFPGSAPANLGELAEAAAPGLRTLIIGETYTRDKSGNLKGKVDSPEERNRKFHAAAQNDYDLILISQPAFNDLDLDPVTKESYASEDFWAQRGDAMELAGDKRRRAIRESYDQHMASRDFDKRSDAIYFGDLGIDMLIADEGHAYKNLYAAKQRFGESPKFLGGQGLSNRALDMQLKCRAVREKAGGGNVYLLSATPTKNSPLEVYSMLAHIAPEAFENVGIRNSEDFLDRYCEFERGFYPNSMTGELESGLITVGFKNMDELRGIMRRYIDRKTAADVGLSLPERDNRLHSVDMSAEQRSAYASLREAAAKARDGGKDANGDSHIFSFMDKMGKASLDLELLGLPDSGSPKLKEATETIALHSKECGQVIFCDSIKSHEKIAKLLEAQGIPRAQIAIINATEAPESAKRQNISDAFNAGKLKVVIGNTATMGEGMNLQKATTDIHHLDLPWDPASLQQRNGRGVRQGNTNAAVRIHTYLAKGSFDAYRHRSLSAKRDWMDALWNGGDRIDNIAREFNITADDMMVLLSPDPDAARAALDADRNAARARLEKQQRSAAAESFVRYRELKRNFDLLKEKSTPAAARLRSKIDTATAMLRANPAFLDKAAIDAPDGVAIHPGTGVGFRVGQGVEISGGKGHFENTGRWVVTGVNERGDQVGMRQFGAPDIQAVVDLSDLDANVKPFDVKPDEESAEMERRVLESGHVYKHPKDLAGLSDSTLEKIGPTIQAQLKSAALGHKMHFTYGNEVPVVGEIHR